MCFVNHTLQHFGVFAISSFFFGELLTHELLIVIDYSGTEAEKIGKNIYEIQKRESELSKNVRLVLIERQAPDSRNDYYGEINSVWYARFLGAGNQEDMLKYTLQYKFPSNRFMEVRPLDELVLRDLANEYAGSHKLTDDIWNSIWRHSVEFEKFDSTKNEMVRPLILLFVVDAYMDNLDNDNAYHRWSLDDVLKFVIKRYRDKWENTILCKENEGLFEAIKSMVLYTTVTGTWDINDQPPEYFIEAANQIKQLPLSDRGDILWHLNETSSYQDKLLPFTPDILGEYYVLHELSKDRSPNDAKEIIEALWGTRGNNIVHFLGRCVMDYADRGRFYSIFSRFIDFFVPTSAQKNSPELVSNLLAIILSYLAEKVAISYLDEKVATKFLLTLQKLYNNNISSKAIAENLMRGFKSFRWKFPNSSLYITSQLVDTKDGQKSINKVTTAIDFYKVLFDNCEDSKLIAQEYVDEIFSTIDYNNESVAFGSISELNRVRRKYYEDEDFANKWAKSYLKYVEAEVRDPLSKRNKTSEFLRQMSDSNIIRHRAVCILFSEQEELWIDANPNQTDFKNLLERFHSAHSYLEKINQLHNKYFPPSPKKTSLRYEPTSSRIDYGSDKRRNMTEGTRVRNPYEDEYGAFVNAESETGITRKSW